MISDGVKNAYKRNAIFKALQQRLINLDYTNMKPITDKELSISILVLSTILLIMIQLYVLGSKIDMALNLTYKAACIGVYLMIGVRMIVIRIQKQKI